jgi:phage anti-repressor protein
MTQIYAGNFYSVCISDRGYMYGWGENKNFVMVKDQKNEPQKRSEIFYYAKILNINKEISVKL